LTPRTTQINRRETNDLPGGWPILWCRPRQGVLALSGWGLIYSGATISSQGADWPSMACPGCHDLSVRPQLLRPIRSLLGRCPLIGGGSGPAAVELGAARQARKVCHHTLLPIARPWPNARL